MPRLVGVGLAARAPHARPRFSSRPVARGRPDFYISLRPGGWSCFLSPRPQLCASLKRVWCASSRLDTGSRANVPDHGAGDARAPRRAHAARVRDAERRRAARTFVLARLTRGQAQPCTPPSGAGGGPRGCSCSSSWRRGAPALRAPRARSPGRAGVSRPLTSRRRLRGRGTRRFLRSPGTRPTRACERRWHRSAGRPAAGEVPAGPGAGQARPARDVR